MKPLSLIISICLMCVVPICAQAQRRTRAVANKPAIPNVGYCELIRHPTRYRNKLVNVTANLFGGFEVSALENFHCDEDRSIWVEFSDSYKACTPADVLSAFDDIFRGTTSSNRATVVATGKFQMARGFKKSPRAFLNGFGHLGRYPFQFTLNCLKSVKPAPWA